MGPRSAAASGPRWSAGRAALVGAGGLVALVALSALLYRSGSHAGPVDSDSATVLLEGAAMSHGHLALGGWALSRDSFWTIDALANMVGVLFEGLHPSLLYVVPAVIAAGVVVVGVLLARAQATRAGRLVAALTVLGVLALPSRALSLFYLQGPYHVGTALYALLAFAGLRRRRFDWGWAGAVVLLGLGMLGDLQLAVFGVAPVLGAGILAMARRRSWWAGLTTVAAAPASVLLAFLVREVADLFGTFAVNPANPTATIPQMVANLADLFHYGPALLGVGAGPYVQTLMPTPLSYLHVLAIAALAAGGLAATVSAVRGAVTGSTTSLGTSAASWHVEDLLVLALLADLATFARLDMGGNPAFGRYLTAAIIFGAILAGRLLGRLADGAARRRLGALAVGLTGAVVVAFGAGFASSVAGAAATSPASQLATFLEQHGLTRGLGDYWSASIVTAESAGRVVVRPVVDSPSGRVARYNRQNDVAWYAHHHFQFVVYVVGLGLIEPSDVQATFGSWVANDRVGGYRVLVFSHPIAVSTAGAGA